MKQTPLFFFRWFNVTGYPGPGVVLTSYPTGQKIIGYSFAKRQQDLQEALLN